MIPLKNALCASDSPLIQRTSLLSFPQVHAAYSKAEHLRESGGREGCCKSDSSITSFTALVNWNSENFSAPSLGCSRASRLLSHSQLHARAARSEERCWFLHLHVPSLLPYASCWGCRQNPDRPIWWEHFPGIGSSETAEWCSSWLVHWQGSEEHQQPSACMSRWPSKATPALSSSHWWELS